MAKIFNDSKSFVDMKLKRPPNETVQLFREFMKQHNDSPSTDAIRGFVNVRLKASALSIDARIKYISFYISNINNERNFLKCFYY